MEKRPLKIGIVTQSYYPKPGGVTEVVHHTAEELRARGNNVTIITTHYSGREKKQPGIVRIGRNVLLPVNGAWVNVTAGLGLKRRLKEVFRSEAFDIIQTHCPLVPTLPLMALKAAGDSQKVIGTFHATAESNKAYAIFQRPLRNRAMRLDGRIAVSTSAMNFAARYFPGYYNIIPNGIDCDRFNPHVHPLEELRDGSLNILYVGRMDERKGIPYLFRAIPLAQKRFGKKIRLILVGEGRFRKLLTPRPLKMLGAEILAVGRIDPEILPRYYASADIFCSPATGRESFGIVLLEAMSSGVPIIASDIPGYNSVVSTGRDGLLVQPKNPEAIAASIVKLGENPSLMKELGEHGREKALTYSWSTVVNMLEMVFYRVLGVQPEGITSEPVHQTAR
jgi:phosphatidylinositol alpha-mannosyltransferase